MFAFSLTAVRRLRVYLVRGSICTSDCAYGRDVNQRTYTSTCTCMQVGNGKADGSAEARLQSSERARLHPKRPDR